MCNFYYIQTSHMYDVWIIPWVEIDPHFIDDVILSKINQPPALDCSRRVVVGAPPVLINSFATVKAIG